MTDQLGKRMKEQYEIRTRTYLPRRTYTILRLDGKAFHTFTRGMKRPYDEDFMCMMDETALALVSEIQGAQFAYVQSDEISLLLTDFDKITTDAWFDGQVQKMVSVSASLATVKFNQLILKHIIHKKLYDCEFDGSMTRIEMLDLIDETKLAEFDSRVFTIPDPVEVENYFIWRQKDAVRNSLSMHAQSLYSHKELNGKSQVDMHDMIHEKGENWNDLPDGFKRGRTIKYMSFKDFDDSNRKSVWEIVTPDFLKEREILTKLIPSIEYD